MKSIKRGERLTILLIVLFLLGMVLLVARIVSQASFYMSHSHNVKLGYIYDRNGEVLFDEDATAEKYGADYFLDVGNLIGDNSGRMTNTLVSENLKDLQNYNLLFGAVQNGKSAIYTTLDHDANQQVYQEFGNKNGTAIAYNYQTGEILVCVSKPSVNILEDVDVSTLETGSLLCRAFYQTIPGSTQKVCTTAAAIETIGYDALMQKSYNCTGTYYNNYGNSIECHDSGGHGWQNVSQAFQNSCNPWYAQLVQDLPLSGLQDAFRRMGYRVNGEGSAQTEMDGISIFTASTTIEDTNDSITQWGCIGQGETVISPFQLMMWESAIANGTGQMTQPYLISYRQDLFGTVKNKAKTTYSDSIYSAETAQQVRAIMRENGDLARYSTINYPIGLKTGTAEVEIDDEDAYKYENVITRPDGSKKIEDSLLVGFCDDSNLPIAFCIVIENWSNSDSVTTNNIARTMLNALSQ